MKKQQDSAAFAAIVAAPFGAVGIRTEAGLVRELVYLAPGVAAQDARDRIAQLAAEQVAAYLRDPRRGLALPLAPRGTPFQRRVWAAIGAIGCGRLRTYGELARELGSAPRAVGQACGANWFPLAIPCHRVVGAGWLGGFAHHADAAGFHVGVKRWLLAHEGAGHAA